MQQLKNIAIIPARGGSKRIIGKNIKDFLGKPIVAYSIEAAINSKLFDEVIVSTDDSEIARVAQKYGANVPFFRSKKNADDFATLSDVVEEVLQEYKNQDIEFQSVCCILPTAPFISVKNLQSSYEKLRVESFDTIFPVLQFSFPIQRCLQIKKDKVSMVWQEHLNTRSQDLPDRYHDAGQFYWCDTKAFVKSKKLYTENSGAIVISQLEAQDIDTEIDWKLAELKYKVLNEISE